MSGVLKPCPFCGGNGRFSYGFGYEIYCEECGSRGNTYPSKEQAIARWNKRLSPWHTGTPTETGWYLVVLFDLVANNDGRFYRYETDYFNSKGNFRLYNNCVIAWQKTEPYKESEE